MMKEHTIIFQYVSCVVIVVKNIFLYKRGIVVLYEQRSKILKIYMNVNFYCRDCLFRPNYRFSQKVIDEAIKLTK